MKRILVMGDLHCGSVVGLTPPKYQYGDHAFEQAALWDTYTEMIDGFKDGFGDVDVLVVNGDCIDGKSSRWGATDVITANIFTQIEMAAEVIDYVGAKKILMTYGTPYHVGDGDDFEKFLADKVGARIKNHLYLQANDTNFSIKHKVGSSTVPHGRSTPTKRERLWDMIWTVEKEQHPLSDVIIRSHVHYFDYSGNASYLALTTPALQGLGSKYGARMCSGVVDFGILYFLCEKGRKLPIWDWDIVSVEEQKDNVIVL